MLSQKLENSLVKSSRDHARRILALRLAFIGVEDASLANEIIPEVETDSGSEGSITEQTNEIRNDESDNNDS